MKLRNLFLRFLVIFIICSLGVVHYSLVVAKSKKSSRKTTKTGMPVPIAGKQYTIGSLFNLINTYNPSKNSNFLVAIKGNQVLTDDQDSTSLDGSASADRMQIVDLAWIKTNGNMTITLLEDENLANFLVSDGRVSSTDKNKYKALIAYFTVSINGFTYRLYLNDPFPAKMLRTAMGSVYPAGNTIAKYNFSRRF